MKILVPVDGSPFTKRMLAYLAAHDEWLGGAHQYTLLHVAPAVPPRAAAVLDKDVLQAHYADESDKVFKPLRTFFSKQKITAEFVAKVGPAAETIAAVASKGRFDLLMIGDRLALWVRPNSPKPAAIADRSACASCVPHPFGANQSLRALAGFRRAPPVPPIPCGWCWATFQSRHPPHAHRPSRRCAIPPLPIACACAHPSAHSVSGISTRWRAVWRLLASLH